MFHLPSLPTLRSYTGKSTGEVGVSALAERRLDMEKKRLTTPQQLYGNLQVDEMGIAKVVRHKRNLGRRFGWVDMGGIVPAEQIMANRMLSFVFVGLQVKYVIPIAFFFVRKLTGIFNSINLLFARIVV